jgi:hypothetical protein
MKAYLKVKAKKEMKSAKDITMKSDRPAKQGVYPSCGTKMFGIGNLVGITFLRVFLERPVFLHMDVSIPASVRWCESRSAQGKLDQSRW